MLEKLPDLHVVVDFGKGIPSAVQGEAMLAFETKLRELTGRKLWIEVFKHNKGDDSKLRMNMTKEQRATL